MTFQKGQELLVKIDFGTGFETIGGFRSNSFTINGETIDVTNKDSGGFRQLMEGGFRSISLSGSGVFTSDENMKKTNTLMLGGIHPQAQIIVPGFGTYEGKFAVNNLEISGEHNGEITYSISMDSADVISFT